MRLRLTAVTPLSAWKRTAVWWPQASQLTWSDLRGTVGRPGVGRARARRRRRPVVGARVDGRPPRGAARARAPRVGARGPGRRRGPTAAASGPGRPRRRSCRGASTPPSSTGSRRPCPCARAPRSRLRRDRPPVRGIPTELRNSRAPSSRSRFGRRFGRARFSRRVLRGARARSRRDLRVRSHRRRVEHVASARVAAVAAREHERGGRARLPGLPHVAALGAEAPLGVARVARHARPAGGGARSGAGAGRGADAAAVVVVVVVVVAEAQVVLVIRAEGRRGVVAARPRVERHGVVVAARPHVERHLVVVASKVGHRAGERSRACGEERGQGTERAASASGGAPRSSAAALERAGGGARGRRRRARGRGRAPGSGAAAAAGRRRPPRPPDAGTVLPSSATRLPGGPRGSPARPSTRRRHRERARQSEALRSGCRSYGRARDVRADPPGSSTAV